MNSVKMEKDYLLHKFLNREVTAEELEMLKADPEYASYIKIAELSSGFDIPEMNKDANFETISSIINPVRKLQPTTAFSLIWKVAAIFIVVMGGYFYFTSLNTQVKTDVAKTEAFSLPDNSEVVLNAGSKITYNKKNWDNSREVSLEGEAYFKVTKGNKFSVKTVQGIVTVLGTQFNIFDREGLFTVACYEGLVSVAFNDTLVNVAAGNKIQIENGRLVMDEVAENNAAVWLTNESSFDNIPLKIVLNELERQYPINVTKESVNLQKRFTGSFTHNNLELALKSICEPLQLNYKINKNGAVSINGKNSK